jgi:predicted RNA binding protein YcfA (HicA-like mRNA interferase family)
VNKTLKRTSGEKVIKILCNYFGFNVSGTTGSHVRLSKMTAAGKVGTVVPLHDDLKTGTLHGVLKLAKINPEDFAKFQ